MRGKFSVIFILLIVLSSCTSSAPLPTQVEVTTITNTPAPIYGMKVMSYNILYGGGASPEWEKKLQTLSSFWVGKDRFSNLIKFVQEIDPDLLGLQEATEWEDGDPSVIQSVAKELGMYYYISDAGEGMVQDTALLSKFEIIEAESLSIEENLPSGVMAQVIAPDGEGIYTYVVHLSELENGVQACEVKSLLQHMQPYMHKKIILMGDFNMNRGSATFSAIEQAGMISVQTEDGRGIDQIWASPAVEWTKTKWFDNVFAPIDISDHNPVAAEMKIYPNSAEITPVPVTASSLPEPFIPANLVEGAKTIYVNDFSDACTHSSWQMNQATDTFVNDIMQINGIGEWQAGTTKRGIYLDGEGILINFQFEDNTESEIFFDHGEWDKDAYKRFGIYINHGEIQPGLWKGKEGIAGEFSGGSLISESGKWYQLLITTFPSGGFLAAISDPADPSLLMVYKPPLDEAWSNLEWNFRIGVNTGKMNLKDYSKIKVEAIK